MYRSNHRLNQHEISTTAPHRWQRWITAGLCSLGISLGVLAEPAIVNAAPIGSSQTSGSRQASKSGGQLQVIYNPVRRPFSQKMQEVYRQSQLFEAAIRPLNQNFVFPRNVKIELAECGFVNAFYQPDAHRIVVCYELTEYLAKLFRSSGMSAKEANVQALNATVFTFYHETAHMLIGELDLPITGREEDVADQFSAMLLSNIGDNGQSALLSAAQWFSVAKGPENHIKYMDEHSLNQQRAYSLICLLYGKDSRKYQGLVKRLGYPPERLQKCQAEYAQITRAWTSLMSPHLRNQPQP